MALQNAYEYDGTAMVPTKWIGIRLTPRCEICEARGCDGHSKTELELKAFCREVDVTHYKEFLNKDGVVVARKRKTSEKASVYGY